MQDKDIEQILQEKADNVKMRDFSEVWENIKDEIKEPKREKRKVNGKKLSLILVSAIVVICLALSPIIIKSLTPPTVPPEEVYFSDDLRSEDVESSTMLDGLLNAGLLKVTLNIYSFMDCKLVFTEDNQVKGAGFTFFGYTEPMFYSVAQLYDKNVNIGIEIEDTYDSYVEVNGAKVNYKYKGVVDGMYKYDVYAVHSDVQYVMDYGGLTDNLMEFLTEFFE